MPVAAGALEEAIAERGHAVALLLADRLPQVVRLGTGEAGDRLGDLHRLLLVEDHAVARLGDRPQALVGIVHRVGVALVAGVGVDVAHRAGPVERHQRDQVVELGGLDLAQGVAHPVRLELEHADRLAALKHLVGAEVVERQGRHVRPLPRRLLHDVQGRLDHVEVAQTEEVHLQQADLLDRLHRVLRDRAVGALALGVRGGAAILGELQRHDVRERSVGDHHGGGVDGGVADDPLEALGRLDHLARLGLRVVHAAQLGLLDEVLVEGLGAAHDRLGDQLRQAIARAVVEPEHPRRVARCGSREHPAERDDLRDRLTPVLVRHVLDHALAALDGEVDVDVRHRDALGVQEALEQQVVLERVDVRDPERVGHDRAGRGAAARADGDAAVLREADEVPDDQEVGGEAHLLDHRQLQLEPLQCLGGRRVPVARAKALVGKAAQVIRLGLALRRLEARDQHLPQLHLHLAALRDLHRRGHRLRPGGERLGHLGRVLEIELVRVEAQLRLGERALGLHAQERAVVVVIAATEVVNVRGGHDRPAHLRRDPHDPLVRLVLLGDAVALELEVDVVGAEQLEQVVRVCPRTRGRALHEPPAEPRLQTAREGDHPRGVAAEQLQVHIGLAAPVPLEEAGGAQLHKVPEALVVAGQEGQVVALVAHRVALQIVHEVGLDADDRLDPVLAAGLVVLHRAVHHAVIGEPERRLPE